mmetsp:Transcript_96375/g.276793  ORF Transcript_96375/g.276793 Transcript_96375/m.276793 type:complete len:212 (+) Transcript_96375:188-823(+)
MRAERCCSSTNSSLLSPISTTRKIAGRLVSRSAIKELAEPFSTNGMHPDGKSTTSRTRQSRSCHLHSHRRPPWRLWRRPCLSSEALLPPHPRKHQLPALPCRRNRLRRRGQALLLPSTSPTCRSTTPETRPDWATAHPSHPKSPRTFCSPPCRIPSTPHARTGSSRFGSEGLRRMPRCIQQSTPCSHSCSRASSFFGTGPCTLPRCRCRSP